MCPRATSSIESAITSRETSEVFMPSVPMVMPSLIAMVLNSMGVPPAWRTPRFTCSASRRRLKLHGMVSVQVLAMPTIGRARSASEKPIALKYERAGARSRPSRRVWLLWRGSSDMDADRSAAWSRGEAPGTACPPRPPVLRGLRGGEPGRNAPDRARAARAAPGRGEGRASERVRADPISRAARARGVVEEVGPGVTSLRPGDHVIPLYIPECRQCEFCLSGRTNLCGALLATQGKGLMPDGTSRLSHRGRMLHHYMGTSTFAEWTVVPEIALAKVRPDAPLDKVCLLGCGITTGIGAVLNTARVHPGATVADFGLGGIGLSVIQGAVMAGAGRIIGIDTNPRKFAMARQLGATDVLDPATVPSVAEAVVEMTRGGVDFSFECIGDVEVMGQALACAHKGWGQAIIIGVAGAGEEIHARPFLLVTGRAWRGTAFGGTRGRT